MSPDGWSVALDTTVEQVFRQRDDSGEPWVDVLNATTQTPLGWETVQDYAAWPTPANARYLVPLGSLRAARACVSGYGGLRPLKQRVTRRGLGELLSRAPRLLEAGRLKVVRRADHDADGLLLTEWIGGRIGVPDVQLGIPIRSLDPHSKPTVQLVTPAGATVGFTKLGWSRSARTRVSHEAAAYRWLSCHASGSLRLPRVVDDGQWQGRALLTTRPLPSDARLVRNRDYDSTFHVLRSLSSSQRFSPLGSSPAATALASRVAALRQAGVFPLAAELETAVHRLLAHHGEVGLLHGALHGDWVPWNLALRAGELWAWDLEHWSPCAPVGLDVVLGMTQAVVYKRGVTVAAAMALTTTQIMEQLSLLGLGSSARRAVLDLGRVEVAVRAAELFELSRGWQTGFDSGVFVAVLGAVT